MARSRFHRSLSYRAEQTGLMLATGTVPLTFQRTLMPRSTSDQALITGLSFAANHALASLIQESIQSAALLLTGRAGTNAIDAERWSRTTIAVDGAAVLAGIGLQRAFASRPNERLPRAGARTAGFWLAATGVGGAAIGVLQEGLDRPGRRRASRVVAAPTAAALAVTGEVWRRRRAALDGTPAEDEIAVPKSLGLGIGVALLTTALSAGERRMADALARTASRVLPGNEAMWRPLAHAVSLAAITVGTRALIERGFGMIETREESVEPSFDIPPLSALLSGSTESEVPFATLSKQGRRFVWNAQAADVIADVLGEDAKEVIRIYVGLESADTEEARVALAMRELERTGAFDRKWLLIDLPTGTGYVNYAAVSALEMLSRGDCATVAMQYAARPSPLSLDRVGEGRHHARMLVEAVSARVRRMPEAARPNVVLFGESLGAWTSQDAFINRGTEGLFENGVDYAIWIGTPNFSEWKEQVLRDERADVDSSMIGVFNDIGEWDATPGEARERMRYVMITHHNDGVARFGPSLIIQAPAWLGDPKTRWETVPKGMRWAPTTTFFQVLVDMKNSANVVPGVFAASGHDYRADLLPFFRAVLGFKVTDEQMTRIGDWLEQREVLRSEWVKRHGTADTGLAATLINTWMREDPERARDMIRDRIRELAFEDYIAGGGLVANAPVPVPDAVTPPSD